MKVGRWMPWVALSLAAGSLLAGTWLHDGAAAARAEAERRWVEAERDWAAAERAGRRMDAYRPRYRRWLARGVIGDGGREAWLAALHEAGRSLPELRYRIEPPVPLAGSAGPGVRVVATTLRMTLRHEGELFALLAALRRAPGVIEPRRCELGRQAGGPLEGRCRLLRLSVEEGT